MHQLLPTGVVSSPDWTQLNSPYWAMLLVTALSVCWLAGRSARRNQLEPRRIIGLVLRVLLVGLFIARLFYAAEHPRFVRDFRTFCDLRHGALDSSGGLIAAAVVFWVYTWIHELPRARTLDAIGPPFALAMGFGRLTCLIKGCCWGLPTDLPWGVQFPEQSDPWKHQVVHGVINVEALQSVAVHPTQIYLSVAGFLLAIYTWRSSKRPHRRGQIFAELVAGEALVRFSIDFLRGDVLRLSDRLSFSQHIALVELAVYAGIWAYWRRSIECSFFTRGGVNGESLSPAAGTYGLQ